MNQGDNHLERIQRALPDEYLDELGRKIGIKSEKIETFKQSIFLLSFNFIHRIDINKGKHLAPSIRSRKIKQLNAKFKEFNLLFKSIDEITIVHQAFYDSFGKAIKETDENDTQLKVLLTSFGNFEPNNTVYYPEVIKKLFDKIEIALENTDSFCRESFTYADLESEFFEQYMRGLKKLWPNDSPIRFDLGEYIGGYYKHPYIADILEDLISRIEPSIPRSSIETLIKRVG